jgi:maltose alpha-D-glucosyltransferase/alpha-amylase
MNPCFAFPFGDGVMMLFEEVHKCSMHILLDLVTGNTSTEHKWFKESMKAEKNEYTDHYVWTDSIWIEPDGMACLRGISDRDGSCAVNFFLISLL